MIYADRVSSRRCGTWWVYHELFCQWQALTACFIKCRGLRQRRRLRAQHPGPQTELSSRADASRRFMAVLKVDKLPDCIPCSVVQGAEWGIFQRGPHPSASAGNHAVCGGAGAGGRLVRQSPCASACNACAGDRYMLAGLWMAIACLHSTPCGMVYCRSAAACCKTRS